MPTPRDFVKHDPIAAALRVLLDVCRRMDGEARQARRGKAKNLAIMPAAQAVSTAKDL